MKLNDRSFRFDDSRRPMNARRTSRTACGVALALVCGATSLTLTGCGGDRAGHADSVSATSGGSSASAEKGRATVSVIWPARASTANTRLIPGATGSIAISFVRNGTTISQQILARPAGATTTTASFTGLTPGAYSVIATAFASADGSGVGLAGATTTTTIVSAQTTSVGISMASAIDHLTATLSPASFLVASVTANSLTYSAVDASGNILPLTPSAISFASSDTSVATVDASGTIVGVKAGTTNIVVTDAESGKKGTVAANVVLDYSYVPPTTVVNGQRVNYHTTSDGLEFYDIQAGSGAFPQPGQIVTITYVGSLVDGTVFDASANHGDGTFTFTNQASPEEVIPGFDEAVAGMQIGTVRRVAIPSNLAYGPGGAAPSIPANATIIFDIKLLSIRSTR